MGSTCFDNPIGDLFSSIGDFFGDLLCSDCGDSSSSWSIGPSKTEAHAKKVASELEKMKKKIAKNTEEQENKAIDYIDGNLDALIKELNTFNKKMYGGKQLNIDVVELKNKNELLKKEVRGHIGKVMGDRLVQNDPELKPILEIEDDKERSQKFNEFCKKIQKQAIRSLKNKIEKTVNKQNELIRKELTSRLNEIDANMKLSYKALQEIKKKKQTNDSMEPIQVQHIYTLELDDILLQQLK